MIIFIASIRVHVHVHKYLDCPLHTGDGCREKISQVPGVVALAGVVTWKNFLQYSF